MVLLMSSMHISTELLHLSTSSSSSTRSLDHLTLIRSTKGTEQRMVMTVGNFVQSVDINKELSLGHFKRQQSGSGNADGENFSQQLDGFIGYESENVDRGEMHKKKKKKKQEVESLHDIDSTVKFGVREADGKHVSSRNPRIEKCISMLDNLVGSLDLPKVNNSAKGKVLMQAMYGVKVETVFICRVFTTAFSGSSKKLSDLNVADIHSWALDFRRLQNLVNEEIRVRFSGGKFTVLNELEAVDASVKILYPTIQAGVDTVEIEWLLKTIEELRAGAEKLSQGNDLLAKGVDGFFEAVMTSRDTLLSSVRFDKTVNDRSPGRSRDMQLVH
ncbi:hypothetical protein JHK82_012397 [Glycine max]|nr:hypothetical protein JHK85_012748 [Glycine max]KAG5154428.1 hypothetical protein JHK82_012397 [Glycine max]